MALAWKAGWVQALAGSNPASSANLKLALTCGNAVGIRSARDGVASTSRRPIILIGKEGNRLLERVTGEITDTADYRATYADPDRNQ
jgi:hypothetical protein